MCPCNCPGQLHPAHERCLQRTLRHRAAPPRGWGESLRDQQGADDDECSTVLSGARWPGGRVPRAGCRGWVPGAFCSPLKCAANRITKAQSESLHPYAQYGDTALHFAAGKDLPRVCRALIKRGADAWVRNKARFRVSSARSLEVGQRTLLRGLACAAHRVGLSSEMPKRPRAGWRDSSAPPPLLGQRGVLFSPS